MSAVEDDGTLSEISNQDEQYLIRNDSASSDDGEDAQIQDLLNRKTPQKTVDSQIFTIQLPLIGKIPISKVSFRLIVT